MKVIITGVTGYLGTEILKQCVAHPQITSIIALARRDLGPEWQNEKKIKTIKVTDFGEYSEADLEAMKGADGCLWTLGTTPQHAKTMTPEQLTTVNVDWPTKAAEAFSKLPTPDGKPFRFVYTSGMLVPAVENLDQKLWFSEDFRKQRAVTEINLRKIAESGKLDQYVTRPAFITDGDPIYWKVTMGRGNVSKEAMSACYIDLLINGNEKKALWNTDLRELGAAALKKFAALKN